MRIEHILCPTDFSEASAHAVDQAVVIAGWYKRGSRHSMCSGRSFRRHKARRRRWTANPTQRATSRASARRRDPIRIRRRTRSCAGQGTCSPCGDRSWSELARHSFARSGLSRSACEMSLDGLDEILVTSRSIRQGHWPEKRAGRSGLRRKPGHRMVRTLVRVRNLCPWSAKGLAGTRHAFSSRPHKVL